MPCPLARHVDTRDFHTVTSAVQSRGLGDLNHIFTQFTKSSSIRNLKIDVALVSWHASLFFTNLVGVLTVLPVWISSSCSWWTSRPRWTSRACAFCLMIAWMLCFLCVHYLHCEMFFAFLFHFSSPCLTMFVCFGRSRWSLNSAFSPCTSSCDATTLAFGIRAYEINAVDMHIMSPCPTNAAKSSWYQPLFMNDVHKK